MTAPARYRRAWRKVSNLVVPAVLGVLALVIVAHAQRPLAGPVSREQAVQMIYDIIVPAKLDHNVTAFLVETNLVPGDVLQPYGQPERQRTIASPTWFGWIDDNPKAFFEHNTRYVLIDIASGNASVVVEGWWPELNGQSLFMTDEEWTNDVLVVYSCIHAVQIGAGP